MGLSCFHLCVLNSLIFILCPSEKGDLQANVSIRVKMKKNIFSYICNSFKLTESSSILVTLDIQQDPPTDSTMHQPYI